MTKADFRIDQLDHLVMTASDLAKTVTFYSEVLGMDAEQFSAVDGSQRWALNFGDQKINLHQAGAEFEPKARQPGPGTADLCFLSEQPVDDWCKHLRKRGIAVIEGPVKRTGACGLILSIYLRDPDGNLIEISNRL